MKDRLGVMAGVAPKFSPVDLVRALLALSKDPLSRMKIVEGLGLGEGSVRSVLNDLKRKGLVSSSRRGHTLSQRGLLLKKDIENRIKGPRRVECRACPQPFRACLSIKKPDMPVNLVLLRDIALKWGADACLVLIAKDSTLHAPKAGERLDVDARNVQEVLEPRDGDVVVVTFAETQSAADTSALAVAIRADPWLRSFVWNTLAGKRRGLPLP